MPSNTKRRASQKDETALVYAYFRKCFRKRGDELLALTEKQFEGARGLYVGEKRREYFARPNLAGMKAPRANKRDLPQRRPKKGRGRFKNYLSPGSTGVLDSSPTAILEVVDELHAVRFGWIILGEEFKRLERQNKDSRKSVAILRQKYSYLPQTKDDTFQSNVGSAPADLAYDIIAKKWGYGNKDEPGGHILKRMLAPSKRRSTGIPFWLAKLYQNLL